MVVDPYPREPANGCVSFSITRQLTPRRRKSHANVKPLAPAPYYQNIRTAFVHGGEDAPSVVARLSRPGVVAHVG